MEDIGFTIFGLANTEVKIVASCEWRVVRRKVRSRKPYRKRCRERCRGIERVTRSQSSLDNLVGDLSKDRDRTVYTGKIYQSSQYLKVEFRQEFRQEPIPDSPWSKVYSLLHVIVRVDCLYVRNITRFEKGATYMEAPDLKIFSRSWSLLTSHFGAVLCNLDILFKITLSRGKRHSIPHVMLRTSGWTVVKLKEKGTKTRGRNITPLAT